MFNIPACYKIIIFIGYIIINRVDIAAGISCKYDPEISISDGMENTPDTIYSYVPFYRSTEIGNNSIILMDKYGKSIACISAQTLNDMKGYEYEDPWKREPAFFTVKIYEEDIMLATMQRYYRKGSVYLNDYIFVFMDMNFKPIPGMPDIMPNTSSMSFQPHYNVFPHDSLILDEKYFMVSIYEYILADASDFYPNVRHIFKLYTTSYMVVDRQTSNEIAAMSGFYFFLDPDFWDDWLSTRMRTELLRHDKQFHSFSHVSSIVKVPGEHWDTSLEGKRTFLCTTSYLNTNDLFIWDFEKGEMPYFIWRMPHGSTAKALYPWIKHWEYVNDPQLGTTESHDINIYNEEPKHFLIHDNGGSSRYDTKDGRICPLTRAVEYRIDYNANGEGYHKATLTWSFPASADLPPTLPADIEFSDVEGTIGNLCIPWFYYHTYVGFGGSVRRLIKGQPYIGHVSYSIDNYDKVEGWPADLPLNPFDKVEKYRVYNSDTGEIVGRWNTTVKGFLSFRIAGKIPQKISNTFTGDYSHEINYQEI